jgi:hypothetical protein
MFRERQRAAAVPQGLNFSAWGELMVSTRYVRDPLMKPGLPLLAVLILIGVPAHADDTPTNHARSARARQLKDCMSKQAANDPGNVISHRNRTATCKKQIRAYKHEQRFAS